MTMRCLKPGSRRQCQLLLGGDTAAFCASLVEGLAELKSALSSTDDGGESVSMRWCADAMLLVRRMQNDLLAIFRRADAPATVDSCCDGGGDWFEHYMQETAALLDFCNAFKSAVARLHRYSMVVDFAAQVGCGADAAVSLVAETAAPCGGWPGPPSNVRGNKLSDVKAVASEAERLGRKIMSNSSAGHDAGGSMVVVTLVAKITMAVVSTSVLRALASPAPINIIGGQYCALSRAAVPEQLRPWRESLSAINARRPASVAEHEKVAMAVRDMVHAAKMGGEEHVQVELLRTRSGELREGVEVFDRVLDQVFDEVIKGRNEMLGIFRDKALTLG